MNPDQQNQNPDQSPQPDPKLQNVYNPLSVMRDNEKVLCEIKRHPIGIVGVYAATAIVILAVFAVAAILPSHITNITTQDKAASFLGALIVTVIALLYAYVAHVVYAGNRWILTDDSLTQVTQNGLFRKHSSQLSLANLEDITADQNGLFQSMFGYGDLHAETAGERSKFVFAFCPKPNDYARQILAAREAFIMDDPGAAKRANDKLMTPGMSQNFGAAQPGSQSQPEPQSAEYNPEAPAGRPQAQQPTAADQTWQQPAAIPPGPPQQYQQPVSDEPPVQQAPPTDYAQPQAYEPVNPPPRPTQPEYPPSADTEQATEESEYPPTQNQ